MIQGYLFARPTDPATSHQAAKEIMESGQTARDEAAALECMRLHPGLTSRELEAKAGVMDGKFRKRLATLRRKGLARTEGTRRDETTGKTCQLWYAV